MEIGCLYFMQISLILKLSKRFGAANCQRYKGQLIKAGFLFCVSKQYEVLVNVFFDVDYYVVIYDL